MQRITMGRSAALSAAALLTAAAPASAQKDYYNLGHGRPLRVEDAYATERYAFEFEFSPLTLSGGEGALLYQPSLEVKHGLLAGMEVSLGVGGQILRANGETASGFGALELSALYNLNSETLRVPALGLRASAHVPLEGEDGSSLELRAILTRVLGGPWRAHLNGAAVLGDDSGARWWGGLAVDRVFPFQSLLLLAETYYEEPTEADAEGRVHSSVGLRYQLTPRSGIDLGVGRDWTGTDAVDWRVTLGVATALGFRSLMP